MIDIDEFERQQVALEPSQIADAIRFSETIVASLGKQMPKIIDVWANGTEHCPNCDANLTGIHFGVRGEGNTPEEIIDQIFNATVANW